MLRLDYMPDVTDDERGRRIFQLHKERAVETALEKIRRSAGSGWQSLSAEDISTLTTMLGEAWVSIERSTWGQYAFSRLKKKDLEEIISIGNDVKNNRMREETAINMIDIILKGSI
jgi:hypothetical protein